ncbi:MAG TPA: NADH-quinone oxidoreductase subunit NuoN [Alphaproteobacteria bacterium]|jgi:NADH-quinone oxidoreductase subunit N|nr:NADH-quinone oxidoreductase subunit NuoN [Alphaproteobacteria bacterium]
MDRFSLVALSPAWPEVFLALSGMALLMIGVYGGGPRGGNNSFRLVSWLAVAAMVVTGGLVTLGSDGGSVQAFGGVFIADSFARFMKVLILGSSALTLLLSLAFAEKEDMARFEYPVLFVFATLGMMMMVSANDLLSLYLALELQSLTLYIIAAFRRDSLKSTEAGLKYFVLGALSSGMLLYGITLVYGFAGSISFPVLAETFANGVSIGAVFGLVFIAAGLAFKVAAVPFHMWTPDVYEGAPTPVTAFFSVAPKVAAVGLFVRVMMGPFAPLAGEWQQIIVFISIASMALGAVAAINQTNIKRLMAYSSISHIGYVLIGLAAATEQGVEAIGVYLAIYIFMSIGTFAVILAMRSKGVAVEGIDDLKGLARTRPGLALAMAIFMFAMAGIPPLAGFFGKLYVFLAAVQAGMYALAVFGVLASVVAAYYYVRIVKIMYFDEPVGVFDPMPGAEVGAITFVSAVFVMFFFVYPQPILIGAARAAHALFAG